MTAFYTYEFATRHDGDGHWRTTIHAEQASTRDPRSVARGLLEQWIIARPERLPGGSRVVVHGRRLPRHPVLAEVRVRVYSSRHLTGPVATAYLTRSSSHRAGNRAA